MADSNAAKGGGKVRIDDIVARVIPDPASGQGATLLTGFVGRSDADGRIRIYPNLNFSYWYDVAEDDVLNSVALSSESSPLGGSHVWVKSGADIKAGPSAQQQQPGAGGAAAFAARPGAQPTPPFSIQPTCGIACTVGPAVCPTIAENTCVSTQCPTQCPTMIGCTCPSGDCTFFGNCPPCTVPSTLCPTVDVQTCPPNCAQQHPAAAAALGAAAIVPTAHGTTCPRNICTETIPPTQFGTTCPRHICTETIVPTRFGTTCPRFICTETIPPTVHVTCPPHICHETITPAAAGVQAQALQPTPTATFFHTCGAQCAVAQPTPTATFFHTCGVQCASGVLTIVCTQGGCHQGWTVAQPTPTATFNPTQCTRCFICPPITAPTRTGVFDPLA